MAAQAKTSVDKGKADSSVIKTKTETTIKRSTDSKLKSVSIETKSEVNRKPSGALKGSLVITTTTTRVKEKKVFALPGQKYDTPEEREPLRIFYESLSEQIPTSDMAQFWMMEHGLLSAEKAKRAYEKKLIKQKELRTGTPIKSITKPATKLESSKRQLVSSENGDIKTKRKIINDSEDEDDDFISSPRRRK